ncbi:hypothetical protein RCL_jg11214.t1 [Rhizophagus clarus]|uniref:Uncharacterized protein n=1 Tax=Rhizophagus clarus TaxID=94130 RepID=A0A8H3R338_9GLOM|nr:hypothetical protein RCL_jg11214.t1 [Rhizophagus clarus]
MVNVLDLIKIVLDHKTNNDRIKSEEFWVWVLDNSVKEFLGAFLFQRLSIGFFRNELWSLEIGTCQRQEYGRLSWTFAPMSQA